VNILQLSSLITKSCHSWTIHQRYKAFECLRSLREGALPVFEKEIPSGFSPNAHSAFSNGSLITDTLCTWIKSHFVCGPFDQPPYSNFLCNPLQAVPQKDKVRPVLNLSHPKGSSFNDALSHFHLPKPLMTSAHIFSFALYTAGRNAIFSKFDMKSAYKNIPQHPSLWRAQGFEEREKNIRIQQITVDPKGANSVFDFMKDGVLPRAERIYQPSATCSEEKVKNTKPPMRPLSIK
jgi:hypothetical protein